MCEADNIDLQEIKNILKSCNKADYRQMSRRLHPDKNSDCSEEAAEKFSALSSYYKRCKKDIPALDEMGMPKFEVDGEGKVIYLKQEVNTTPEERGDTNVNNTDELYIKAIAKAKSKRGGPSPDGEVKKENEVKRHEYKKIAAEESEAERLSKLAKNLRKAAAEERAKVSSAGTSGQAEEYIKIAAEKDEAAKKAEAQAREAQLRANNLKAGVSQVGAQARAQAQAEAQARAQAQAEAQARAQAEAQARAQAEAQARAQAEAQARAQAEAQARAQAQAEAQARAQAEASRWGKNYATDYLNMFGGPKNLKIDPTAYGRSPNYETDMFGRPKMAPNGRPKMDPTDYINLFGSPKDLKIDPTAYDRYEREQAEAQARAEAEAEARAQAEAQARAQADNFFNELALRVPSNIWENPQEYGDQKFYEFSSVIENLRKDPSLLYEYIQQMQNVISKHTSALEMLQHAPLKSDIRYQNGNGMLSSLIPVLNGFMNDAIKLAEKIRTSQEAEAKARDASAQARAEAEASRWGYGTDYINMFGGPKNLKIDPSAYDRSWWK